jgi:adhesin transport system membrane fusion protein
VFDVAAARLSKFFAVARRGLSAIPGSLRVAKEVVPAFFKGGKRGEAGLRRQFLWLIVFALMSFLGWASISEFDRVVSGEGKVIPYTKLQTAQHYEGGIISKIFVAVGEKIRSGDALLGISPLESSGELDVKQGEYSRLLARVRRLQSEASGKAPVFGDALLKNHQAIVQNELALRRARELKLMSLVASFDSQLAQKRSEKLGIEKTLALISEEYTVVKRLVDRGLEPKLEAVRAEKSLAETEARLETIKGAIQEILDKKAIARQDNLAEVLTELATATAELRQVEKSLPAATDKAERTVLRSPVDGTVNRVLVTTIGGVLKAGEPAVEIVPVDARLILQTKVLPADIGFVVPGQKAIIKLSTYDFSIFGSLPGVVRVIGSDSITDEKGNVFYLVDIEPEGNVTTTGRTLTLIPGMVAQVDVVTGTRSVMSYITSPVTRTLSSAFTEK